MGLRFCFHVWYVCFVGLTLFWFSSAAVLPLLQLSLVVLLWQRSRTCRGRWVEASLGSMFGVVAMNNWNCSQIRCRRQHRSDFVLQEDPRREGAGSYLRVHVCCACEVYQRMPCCTSLSIFSAQRQAVLWVGGHSAAHPRVSLRRRVCLRHFHVTVHVIFGRHL